MAETYKLYQDKKSTCWSYSFTVGKKRVRKSTGTSDYNNAHAIAKASYDAAKDAVDNPDKLRPISLEAALDYVINQPDLSENTIITYRRAKAKLTGQSKRNPNAFGFDPKRELHTIRNSDLQLYHRKRVSEGLSRDSITLEISLLKTANRKLRGEYLTNNDLSHPAPASATRHVVITVEQEKAILKRLAADPSQASQDAHALATLLFTTGVRLNEAMTATADMFDLEAGTFRVVRSKHKRAQHQQAKVTPLPLPERTVAVLKPRLDRQPLFGSPNTAAVLRRVIAAVCHKDGQSRLERATIHSIRHTVATRLLNADRPAHVIQQVLGHSDSTMLRRYTSTDLTTHRDALLAVLS